ncbi:MAG: hypothetical protein IJ677_01715 [Alphaproteobacteria bacterium]|nr:hypothetical protein [Alphaproteobacteria bacterium]
MSEVAETNKISKELNKIYRHLLQNDKKVAQLQNDFNRVCRQMQGYYKELNFADLLHDTIINSTWLHDKSFSLHGWAANYSFIYMLYRILDNTKPQNILEMGMGQTSRLTSQYVAYCNQNATLDIIENDSDWIATYQPQLAQNEHIKVHQRDLEFFTYDKTECRKYKDLNEIVGNTKYDLIIIDGPWGAEQKLPRSNMLDLIKNGNVADDFVIIFDDTERKGEKNTSAQAIKLLQEQSVETVVFHRFGIKTQTYITSLTKSFIQYL